LEDKNNMRLIYLDKVVINIGTGSGSEDTADNAKALIKKLTDHEAGYAFSKRRDPELKLRQGQKIGALATLRKEDAYSLLKRALDANNNVIGERAISKNSLNFGVKEYIYFAGVKYDPKIGILGMNINAAFARKGKRVESRKRKRNRVSKKHRDISREEILQYLEKNFNVKIA
jgi:large subunit ribosomal protein L5